MISDFRVGLRLLWRDKAFTLTAALTLALCIGANTALFSVVHNVLLRPLPVPESDRIVLMGNAYPGAGRRRRAARRAFPTTTIGSAKPTCSRSRRSTTARNQSIDQKRHAGARPRDARRRRRSSGCSESRRRSAARSPTHEGEIGNEKKVVLSYALWQSQFGGDPQAIGKDLRIDGQPFTVVGVMPKGFYFLNPKVMLWRPLAFTAAAEERRAAAQQQLPEHRPAQARRDRSKQARAADRRAQRAQPREVSRS